MISELPSSVLGCPRQHLTPLATDIPILDLVAWSFMGVPQIRMEVLQAGISLPRLARPSPRKLTSCFGLSGISMETRDLAERDWKFFLQERLLPSPGSLCSVTQLPGATETKVTSYPGCLQGQGSGTPFGLTPRGPA